MGQNKEEEWTFEMIDQESSRVANYFSNNVGLKKVICVKTLWFDEMEKSLLDLSPNFTLYCSKSGVSPEDITRKRSPVSKDFDEIVSKSPANRGASQNISLSPSSVIFYIYTSGTTGLPKPVKITHMRQMVILMAIKNLLDLNSEDTSYCYLPLYHASGIQLGIGNAFANGGKVVIKKKFSARNFWKDCVKYKVTATQYIGEICRFLLATKPIPEETQHSIRIIYGNGLRPEIWAFFFLIELITPIHLIKVNPQTLEVYRDENGLCVQCDVVHDV
ncbi:SLC27A1_4 [Lepeophtheirus salmonis]|uniref:Long-chain-fatty-acid--CoA ligase n=1 Tax=Lepeophtheirus salmonis TaxID=72036 RepID=A0A7R8H008_LEPSM|nr:SLC27A1_4 [Lepeophtheirus salmonis]CAF2775442.1 SLC27A1_4 [Lepeophtheirus salmonis]